MSKYKERDGVYFVEKYGLDEDRPFCDIIHTDITKVIKVDSNEKYAYQIGWDWNYSSNDLHANINDAISQAKLYLEELKDEAIEIQENIECRAKQIEDNYK